MVLYIGKIWNSTDSDLSKLGVISSTLGVWIATYIAIWLINQNRVKSIEENHVYKIQLLTNLESTIHTIWAILFYAKTHSEEGDRDKLMDTIKQSAEDFQYWTSRINLINQNTHVPPKIRDLVNMLIHQGIKAIYEPFMAIKYSDYLDKVLFLYLDNIIDSEYMVQSDETVDHYRKMIKDSRIRLADLILKNVETSD
jgi:phosphoribulokinase